MNPWYKPLGKPWIRIPPQTAKYDTLHLRRDCSTINLKNLRWQEDHQNCVSIIKMKWYSISESHFH